MGYSERGLALWIASRFSTGDARVLVDAGRGTLVEGALVELSVMLSLAYCATRAQLLFKH